MPGSITLPDDQEVTVPLKFADAIGAVHAPATGGTASSDNTAVATVTVAADDQSVLIVSVADGTCNVTYTNGSLSDTLAVTVAAPTPTSVALDVADAVFSAKP